MELYSLKNLPSLGSNNEDIKIRISISKVERMVEEDRINRLKSQPLTIEERIIKFSPLFSK